MDLEEAERKAKDEERKAFVESQKRQMQQMQGNQQSEEYIQDGQGLWP